MNVETPTPGRSRVDEMTLHAMFAFTLISVVGLTFSIAVSSIAMGVAIFLLYFLLVRKGSGVIPKTPLDTYFLCYALAELVSTVFSVDPLASAINMKRLLLISFVYFVLMTVDSDFKVKALLGFLLGITALLSLFELFSLSSIGGHYMRVSLFQYYMTEGGIKMFVLLLAIPFVIHPATPRSARLYAICCTIPVLAGLILTQTRSSWLGFIAGILTVAILKNKKLALVLLGFIILFVLLAPADFRTRAESIFDPMQRSNLSRIHMITTGWRMFLDRPVVGTGDIDLKKLYVTYITPIDEGEGGHLHNNVMMLLVTLGVVGFAATMAMFVKVFLVERECVRLARDHWLFGSLALGSLASYVGFHVNGLFEWNFGDHEIAVLLWCTVGMSLLSRKES